MTAPNEPGSATPRAADGAEPPQRQQGLPQPVRPRSAAPRPPEQPAGHSPGVNERLRRFMAGGSATSGQSGKASQAKSAPPVPDPARDSQHVEPYASELPDLSGPVAARSAQRKPPVQRPPVAARPRGPLRASMQIRRIDPWSTLKVSLLLAVALFFVWMFAVAVLYVVLGGMGVWAKLNSNVGDLLSNSSGATDLVSSGSIFGGALLIGLVNIVVLTAMATLGAVIYNLSTDLIGGIEVTLADRD